MSTYKRILMAHQSSQMQASVTSLRQIQSEPEVVDLTPSDSQPPGVDEYREPQSLEEALLGE